MYLQNIKSVKYYSVDTNLRQLKITNIRGVTYDLPYADAWCCTLKYFLSNFKKKQLLIRFLAKHFRGYGHTFIQCEGDTDTQIVAAGTWQFLL